jgi:integrase
MPSRLTDVIVRRLPTPVKGNKIEYDTEVKGFGVRVTAAGARSFILNYRRQSDGLERRETIGSWPTWSVKAAREEAKRLRRAVDGGADPVGEARALRDAETVNDLAGRYLVEHVAKLAEATTQKDYRSVLEHDVLPALGKKKIAAVEREDIERLHTAISKGAPVRANRALAIMASMFKKADDWKLRSGNPCKGIKRNQEHSRERYLTPQELERLVAALGSDPNQEAADVFRLLLLTGARKGEVLAAQWKEFDFGEGLWTKPHAKTKQRRTHRIPLNAPSRALLAERLKRRAGDTPWVFPGRNGNPREDLKYCWKRLLRAAGIVGVRIHDLRHSHASFLASAGFSLPVIGRLLGHSNPQTTARFAHLFDDPLRQATERVGAIMSGKPIGEVLPLNKRGRR